MQTLLRIAFCIAVLAAFRPAIASAAEEGTDYTLASEVNAYLADTKSASDPHDLRVWYKNGLNFATADKNFTLKIGGRIMLDQYWIAGDDNFVAQGGETDDLTFFRRARLFVSGTIYKNTVFKAQYDFAKNEEVALKDLYIGLRKTRFGTILFGHQKSPMGLEELTSSKYITFMERSVATQAFNRSRNTGLEVYWDGLKQGDTPRLTFRIGLFRPTDSDSGALTSNSGSVFGLRLTYLAIDNETSMGKQQLHLGFSFQLESPDEGGTLRYRARPNIGAGARPLDTGGIAADDAMTFAFEIAHLLGSFSWQAEFYMVEVDDDAGADPGFQGWYVQISYWVTGEMRKYKASRGVFSRVTPIQNFHAGEGSGWGAIEIAVRFGETDLTDSGIDGGEWEGFTIGVNWHWNPNTRMMFNLISGENDKAGITGDFDAFGIRWQIDF